MGNIATTETSTAGGGDYRWLASARGTAHPKSATLDGNKFTPVDGVIPAGTPVQPDASTGRFKPAEATSTKNALAGFVYHDIPHSDEYLTFALLTDATVIASYVPGTHDLTDGRYINNTVKPA